MGSGGRRGRLDADAVPELPRRDDGRGRRRPDGVAPGAVLPAVPRGDGDENNGQIRYTSVFEAPGEAARRGEHDLRDEPERPAAGFSLYRFSTGHGGLQCAACHGSTHAEYPASTRTTTSRASRCRATRGCCRSARRATRVGPLDDERGPARHAPGRAGWVEGARGRREVRPRGLPRVPRHGRPRDGPVARVHEPDVQHRARDRADRGRRPSSGCYTCHNGPRAKETRRRRRPRRARRPRRRPGPRRTRRRRRRRCRRRPRRRRYPGPLRPRECRRRPRRRPRARRRPPRHRLRRGARRERPFRPRGPTRSRSTRGIDRGGIADPPDAAR